ncbi:hypothetical protein U1Q18_028919, partial [Sarracenia purpurea var. burkii]
IEEVVPEPQENKTGTKKGANLDKLSIHSERDQVGATEQDLRLLLERRIDTRMFKD